MQKQDQKNAKSIIIILGFWATLFLGLSPNLIAQDPLVIEEDGKVHINTSLVVQGLKNTLKGSEGTETEIPESAKLTVIGGAIRPSIGKSSSSGIIFPNDPGTGVGDSAWIRYYVREGDEDTNFEIGTTNDPADNLLLITSGRLGIGKNRFRPTKALVEIDGFTQNRFVYPFAFYDSNHRHGMGRDDIPYEFEMSLYASHRIASTSFIAHSDKRVKSIVGKSDSKKDLKTLQQVEITDYYYRDSLSNGNLPQKKVIGQQVAQVYPQSVFKQNTEIVPDIMQIAEIKDGWVELTQHSLKKGEKVRLIFEEGKEELEVLTAEENTFQVQSRQEGKVFVYGREVYDFHLVDYEALSMLNISATQELARKVESLENEKQELQQYLNELDNRLQKIEARFK